MNIHEYQAKKLLERYGIPIPRGVLPASAREASTAAEKLGGKAVIKAQIHAGGRGAAGGVRLAENPKEAAALFEEFIGARLVTRQTGPEGRRIRKVYIEEALDIVREIYLALTLDRKTCRLQFVASGAGGTGIEEASETLFRASIDPVLGPTGYSLRELAETLDLSGPSRTEFLELARKLYRLFQEQECSLAEINPLAITRDDRLVALDAKMSFDDNALFRHPEVLDLRDFEEESPEEFEASKHGLSYVRLDGSIGCLVNGAGLAMATLDALSLRGGSAANFLDIGGGVSEDAVKRAFRLLLTDTRMKAVLVNIFGGIVRCDAVASGIARASGESNAVPPVIVRLSGNRAEEGKLRLKDALLKTGEGLTVLFADDMAQAACLAVSAATR